MVKAVKISKKVNYFGKRINILTSTLLTDKLNKNKFLTITDKELIMRVGKLVELESFGIDVKYHDWGWVEY